MSSKTNIQWCDSTWNPWIGCTKVSPGCAHCYAEQSTPARVSRKNGLELWGDQAVRKVTSDATFNAPLSWNNRAFVCDECGTFCTADDVEIFACPNPKCICCQGSPVHPSFHRRRVFTLSLGDWLDPRVGAGIRLRFFHTIFRCQELLFLCVTKRPELFKKSVMDCLDVITDGSGNNAEFWQWLVNWIGGKPPVNVWVIASAEDQPRADERIPHLLQIPAAVHGISMEPALESINIGWTLPFLDWVIVGGESGSNARPCNIEWLRSVAKQCQAAKVPVFVKQLGSYPILTEENPIPDQQIDADGTSHWWELSYIKHPKGGDLEEWPIDLRVQEFPDRF